MALPPLEMANNLFFTLMRADNTATLPLDNFFRASTYVMPNALAAISKYGSVPGVTVGGLLSENGKRSLLIFSSNVW